MTRALCRHYGGVVGTGRPGWWPLRLCPRCYHRIHDRAWADSVKTTRARADVVQDVWGTWWDHSGLCYLCHNSLTTRAGDVCPMCVAS